MRGARRYVIRNIPGMATMPIAERWQRYICGARCKHKRYGGAAKRRCRSLLSILPLVVVHKPPQIDLLTRGGRCCREVRCRATTEVASYALRACLRERQCEVRGAATRYGCARLGAKTPDIVRLSPYSATFRRATRVMSFMRRYDGAEAARRCGRGPQAECSAHAIF